MDQGRVVFLDYIRIVACFFVMVIHASEHFYGVDYDGTSFMSMVATEDNRIWVSVFEGFCRVAVPLFMMVSAYLLVPTRKPMLEFYAKRLRRVVVPTFIFFVLYSLLPLLWGGISEEQSLSDIAHIAWTFPSLAGHLWFIFPLVGLYLIMPVISEWLDKASSKEEMVFIAIFLVTTLMEYLRRFVYPELWGECFWNRFHMLWYFSGFVGYLVIAHYIKKHLVWNAGKRAVYGLIMYISGALFTAWTFYSKAEVGQMIETPEMEWGINFLNINVVLSSVGIFLMFSALENVNVTPFVRGLSILTFPMYLMHMFFLNMFAFWIIGPMGVASPLMYPALAILLIAACTYVSTMATSWVLMKIPGLNRIF